MSFTPYAQDGANRGYGFVNGLYVPQINNAPTLGFANTPFGSKQSIPQDEINILFGRRRQQHFFPQEEQAVIAENVQIIFMVDTTESMDWASGLMPEILSKLTNALETRTLRPINYGLVSYSERYDSIVGVHDALNKAASDIINIPDIPETFVFFSTDPDIIRNASSFNFDGENEPVGTAAVTAANLSLHPFTVNGDTVSTFNTNTPYLFIIFADEPGEAYVDLISPGTLAALPLPEEAQIFLDTQAGDNMSVSQVQQLMGKMILTPDFKTKYRTLVVYGSRSAGTEAPVLLSNFPTPGSFIEIDPNEATSDQTIANIVDQAVFLLSLNENGSPYVLYGDPFN